MEKQRGSLVRTHTPKMTPYKLKGYHSCRHAVFMLDCLSCVQLFVTLWTVIYQAPLSMGFTRQEYCSGLSSSPPGDLPDLKVKPTSLIPFALAVRFFTTSTTWKGPQLQRSSPKELEVQALYWIPQPGDPSLEWRLLRG